jgi:hypothetical protein
MEIYGLNIYNNIIINDEESTKKFNEDILSNKSFDEDTIPDEDFNETNNIKRTKLKSCPNVENKGPNINLKINYKRYSNQKEKELFFEKIKKKKKTELCKNYEFYHDCYYGENCCFAHGVDELRDNILSPNYKTKMCKSFIDNKYCSFGIRCSYLHKIK